MLGGSERPRVCHRHQREQRVIGGWAINRYSCVSRRRYSLCAASLCPRFFFSCNEGSRNVAVVATLPSINTFVSALALFGDAQKHGGVGFDSSPIWPRNKHTIELRLSLSFVLFSNSVESLDVFFFMISDLLVESKTTAHTQPHTTTTTTRNNDTQQRHNDTITQQHTTHNTQPTTTTTQAQHTTTKQHNNNRNPICGSSVLTGERFPDVK